MTPVLIMVALIALVVVNAGGGAEGLKVGRSILIVLAGLLLMALFFAMVVTKPLL